MIGGPKVGPSQGIALGNVGPLVKLLGRVAPAGPAARGASPQKETFGASAIASLSNSRSAASFTWPNIPAKTTAGKLCL